jgi:hypothetical protein
MIEGRVTLLQALKNVIPPKPTPTAGRIAKIAPPQFIRELTNTNKKMEPSNAAPV